MFALTLKTIIDYQYVFKNLFDVVLAGILIAFISNLIISLGLNANKISIIESQVMFSLTGTIVIYFLWLLLKKYEI